MIYNSTYKDEKRVLKGAHTSCHIVFDIIDDDWLIDYFEGGEEDMKTVMNKSVERITVTPFISSGTF